MVHTVPLNDFTHTSISPVNSFKAGAEINSDTTGLSQCAEFNLELSNLIRNCRGRGGATAQIKNDNEEINDKTDKAKFRGFIKSFENYYNNRSLTDQNKAIPTKNIVLDCLMKSFNKNFNTSIENIDEFKSAIKNKTISDKITPSTAVRLALSFSETVLDRFNEQLKAQAKSRGLL